MIPLLLPLGIAIAFKNAVLGSTEKPTAAKTRPSTTTTKILSDSNPLNPTPLLMGVWKHLTTRVHDLTDQIPWVRQNLSDDPAERAQFHCLDATKKMLRLYFNKIFGSKSPHLLGSDAYCNSNVAYTNFKKLKGCLQVNPVANFRVLQIIKTELLANRPVGAVVSYRGMRPTRTNHWVVISGMELDQLTGKITKLYFLDPGTGRSTKNKGELVINEEGLAVGKSPFDRKIYELSGIAVRSELRG
ncbi:MAG: hypothetical protein HYU97_04105 [Deltaproteobacteria bacterium]|nr:hypothetical protein [Deltaproteobacteria bacterium]